ncbi:MAG: hypothetical protein IPJ30_08755 [Acidobacteria bacterium]|nr:hypothetical protein [Acidobacteriota bacterium]
MARLQTEKTEFSANGDLDINGSSSNLHLALASTDAKEIERDLSASSIWRPILKRRSMNIRPKPPEI